MVTIGQYNFDWISNDQCDRLLGTSRPKTLQEIEKDGYWQAIFDQWITWIDANGYSGVKAIYEQWKLDPQGPARDQLKAAGNGDLRQQFYDDLGTVKAAERQWRQESGAGKQMLDNTLDELGLNS